MILAGGKSTRMGENKSFVPLDGKPMLEIVLERITAVFSRPPILVTNSPADYAYLGLAMVGDSVRDSGPLAGIHAGLSHSATYHNYVFACDMPFLDGDFIRYTISRSDGYDVIIPRCYERLEPLHAIYSQKCLMPITESLRQNNLKLIDFLVRVHVLFIETAEIAQFFGGWRSFINVNNREDLDNARDVYNRYTIK